MMIAQPLDLSNLGTTVGSTTATKGGNNATDPQASQDRFLKLLVAQLNNQDPLNPMDNAQMTTQMAQINTVSGIQELNATLKGMAEQSASMQSLQGTSLIGRDALVEGNTVTFDGTTGKGALALAGDAGRVYVDILNKNGSVIDTVDMGSLTKGHHAFEWDAGSINPGDVGNFRVRANNGENQVEATPLARVKVASVAFANGAMVMQLQNGRTTTYDQVRAFM